MASVELRPGDTLNIIWKSTQESPLGVREVESSFAFSYEDLLGRLGAKGRMGKSRRSGSSGARFSRLVALSTNALRKGKWSTGADIDRSEVFAKFCERFRELDSKEYVNVTANAKKSLLKLQKDGRYLNLEQQQQLHGLMSLMGLSPEGSHP